MNVFSAFFSLLLLAHCCCWAVTQGNLSQCLSNDDGCTQGNHAGTWNSWRAFASGAGIHGPLQHLEVKIGGNGLRGLFTSAKLEKGAVFMQVPLNASVCSMVVGDWIEGLPQRCSPPHWALTDSVLLTLQMTRHALEYSSSNPSAAIFAEWLSSLPTASEVCLPFMWESEPLAYMKASGAAFANLQKREFEQASIVIEGLFQCLQDIGHPAGAVNPSKETLSRVISWAFTMVKSRAFGTPAAHSTDKAYSCILPLADMSNHCPFGALWELPSPSRDGNEARGVLQKNLQAGEELCIDYGQFTAANLLVTFGFLPSVAECLDLSGLQESLDVKTCARSISMSVVLNDTLLGIPEALGQWQRAVGLRSSGDKTLSLKGPSTQLLRVIHTTCEYKACLAVASDIDRCIAHVADVSSVSQGQSVATEGCINQMICSLVKQSRQERFLRHKYSTSASPLVIHNWYDSDAEAKPEPSTLPWLSTASTGCTATQQMDRLHALDTIETWILDQNAENFLCNV